MRDTAHDRACVGHDAYERVDDATHDLVPDVLAPVLLPFFA